jgi:triosephosphate isomerase
MDKKYVIGNWKMHGSRAMIDAFIDQLSFVPAQEVVVAIAPPFPYLGACAAFSNRFELAGQDCSAHETGAHTGEVSASMLVEWGCQWVIVGHSERRNDLEESDYQIAAKLNAAIAAGLTPVLCVGESQAARDAGREEVVIRTQLQAALSELERPKLLIAYEPIWAIGTGVTASPGPRCHFCMAVASIRKTRGRCLNAPTSTGLWWAAPHWTVGLSRQSYRPRRPV